MAYTYGLTGIETANLAGDGGPGTTFTTIGYTVPNSTKFVTNRGTATEKSCEELSSPLVSIPGDETMEVQTQVIVDSADKLLALLGGTVVSGKWSKPDSKPVIEKTVKLTPKSGLTFTVNRGSFDGALNATLSKTGDLFYVDLIIKVLQPTKSGVVTVTAE